MGLLIGAAVALLSWEAGFSWFACADRTVGSQIDRAVPAIAQIPTPKISNRIP